jgi:hypothetical protein
MHAIWNNKGIMSKYHNKLYQSNWIFDTTTCVNVYYILSKVPSIYPPNIGCGCFFHVDGGFGHGMLIEA